jgi:Zn-dependent metalloprotease
MFAKLREVLLMVTLTLCILACANTITSTNNQVNIKPIIVEQLVHDVDLRKTDFKGLNVFWFNADHDKARFIEPTTNSPSTDKLATAGAFYLKQYRNRLMLNTHWEKTLTLTAVTKATELQNSVLYYQQHVEGVSVYGSSVRLLLDKNYQLITVSAALAPLPLNLKNAKPFNFTRRKALSFAWRSLTGEVVGESAFVMDKKLEQYQLPKVLKNWQLSSPVKVNKVFFAGASGIESAYQINIRAAKGVNSARHMGYIISAQTGQVLNKKNYVKQYKSR